jgi:hypothetical protein
MRKKTKVRRKQSSKSRESSPLTMLEAELKRLRRDLRATARAYVAKLENDLREAGLAIRSSGPVERLSRDQLHQVRDLTIELRKRKLKPEKGRRKDLRRIDSLIGEVRLTMNEEA